MQRVHFAWGWYVGDRGASTQATFQTFSLMHSWKSRAARVLNTLLALGAHFIKLIQTSRTDKYTSPVTFGTCAFMCCACISKTASLILQKFCALRNYIFGCCYFSYSSYSSACDFPQTTIVICGGSEKPKFSSKSPFIMHRSESTQKSLRFWCFTTKRDKTNNNWEKWNHE